VYSYFVTKLLILVTIFLSAETCFLFVRNRVLEAARTGAFLSVLKAGDKLDLVTGSDTSDCPRKIGLMTENKLLFVYSSKCPACARNFENWKSIEERVGAANVLYLSTDMPSDFAKRYVQEMGIVDRAIFLSDQEEKRKLKITRVPQTIQVIQGEVKAVYVGVLPKETLSRFQPL
jgi:peroxiredoxin